MRSTIKELTLLMISLVKWLFLAILVGCVAGLMVSIFSKLLSLSIEGMGYIKWSIFLLPVAMFLGCFLVKAFAKGTEGHGTERVIKSIHKKNVGLSLAKLPIKIGATIITIAGGGSAGKEGPSTLIGATFASFIGRVLRLKDSDKKMLVICGLGAGFAAVFGTPLAGAVFALEVLIVGRVMLNALFPAIISAISSVSIFKLMAGVIQIPNYFTSSTVFDFSFANLGWCLLAGLFFGIVAFAFIKSMGFFEKLNHKIKIYAPLKAGLAGIVLMIIGLIFGTSALGLGADVPDYLISGHMNLLEIGSQNALLNVWFMLFAIKIITTSITLSFGGSGGIITPTVFIGAASGALFGMMVGNVELFAMLGFVALLSGGSNTPIAAMFLAVEMFGISILPYAAIVCAISYVLVGNRSLFPTQIVGAPKVNTLHPKIGIEIGNEEYLAYDNKINGFVDKLIGFFKKNKAGELIEVENAEVLSNKKSNGCDKLNCNGEDSRNLNFMQNDYNNQDYQNKDNSSSGENNSS